MQTMTSWMYNLNQYKRIHIPGSSRPYFYYGGKISDSGILGTYLCRITLVNEYLVENFYVWEGRRDDMI